MHRVGLLYSVVGLLYCQRLLVLIVVTEGTSQGVGTVGYVEASRLQAVAITGCCCRAA